VARHPANHPRSIDATAFIKSLGFLGVLGVLWREIIQSFALASMAPNSTGPKTRECKEASSRNSLKHGFTARNTFTPECESKEVAIDRWRIRTAL
jgi:hypothetical protein